MFLDKPVLDRNAVQTVSRLNRSHEGKNDVVVVDFTNNARAILGAFARYRKGTPFETEEPDPAQMHCPARPATRSGRLLAERRQRLRRPGCVGNGCATAARRKRASHTLPDQAHVRGRAQELCLPAGAAGEERSFPDLFSSPCPAAVREIATFAEYVGPQLIKQGSISELMQQIRQTEVDKAAVRYNGEVRSRGGEVKLRPGGGRKGVGPTLRKVSIQQMIADIAAEFTISDEEALFIRQVTEEKSVDATIRSTVHAHREDMGFLEGAYHIQVNGEILIAYRHLERYEALADARYTDTGAIFDIMAATVIERHLQAAA
jgi:type I restriction enzyme R subunit